MYDPNCLQELLSLAKRKRTEPDHADASPTDSPPPPTQTPQKNDSESETSESDDEVMIHRPDIHRGNKGDCLLAPWS